MEFLNNASKADPEYQQLIKTIQAGFPKIWQLIPSDIQQYWEVRQCLSVHGDIVLIDQCLVIPKKLRNAVHHHLHSAHQGTTTKQSRASKTIYWPGINDHIKNIWDACHSCSHNAPSHSKELLILMPPSNWHFQKICEDYFESQGHYYLTTANRFSGWICIYHFSNGSVTSNNLITQCRTPFENYGAPDEFNSDGGPQFTLTAFTEFLQIWGVALCLSSVSYPQSNDRAEAAVKTTKHII